MELTGEVAIPASRERVWEALNDPAVLQACIPGCEEVIEESATVRKARVMVKVGPVRARFSGRVTLSEVEAPQRCVMGFEGSGGAAGVASGSSQVELREEGGDTHVSYTVKAAVGGRLGQVGGRMIDASAKQLADQFFEALRVRLAPAGVAGAEAGAEVGAEGGLELGAEGGLEVGADRRLAVSGSEPQRSTQAASETLGFAGAHHQPTKAPPISPRNAPTNAPTNAPANAPSSPLAPLTTEATRILWFLLGAASTGFGFWLAKVLE